MGKGRIVFSVLCLFLLSTNSSEAVDGFSGLSQTNDYSTLASQRVALRGEHLDSDFGPVYDHITAHLAAGQGGQFAHNMDFGRDSANISDTQWAWREGRVRVGNVVHTISAGTAILRDTGIWYFEIGLETPAVRFFETGPFTANDSTIPIWIVQTSRGRIFKDTDQRSWLARSPSINFDSVVSRVSFLNYRRDSGPASFMLTDFSKDTANTTAGTIAIRAGRIKTYLAETVIQTIDTTIGLGNNSTNYIFLDKFGVLQVDTTRVPDTGYLVREARTGTGTILQETDHRGYMIFPGNIRIFVGLDTERTTGNPAYATNLTVGKDFFWSKDQETLYVAKNATTWKAVGSGGSNADSFSRAGFFTVSHTSFTQSGSGNTAVDLSAIDTAVLTIYMDNTSLSNAIFTDSVVVRGGITGYESDTFQMGINITATGFSVNSFYTNTTIVKPFEKRDTYFVTSSSGSPAHVVRVFVVRK